MANEPANHLMMEGSRDALKSYNLTLPMGSLSIGVDNIHHDVFLSPKFVQVARDYLFDLALVIIQQRFVRQLRKLLHKQLVKMLCRFGASLIMEKDEILAHLQMGCLIGFQLTQNKQIAENQDRQKSQDIPMSPQKMHGFLLAHLRPSSSKIILIFDCAFSTVVPAVTTGNPGRSQRGSRMALPFSRVPGAAVDGK